jgi:hypothetical protein
MLLGYGVVDHAKVVLGRIFFETILVSGLGRLSQTCKRYRYLQRDRDSLLGAIVGSTRLGLHLEYRLSLFGMMPRAIIHQSNASIRLIQAASAYEDAASRIDSGPSFVNAFQGIIAGKVLPCGVYEWDRDITLTGNVYMQGLEDDVMILKTTGNLIVGAGAEVILSGGIRACNVFWQVAGFVELGPDAYLHGIFLVKGKAVLQTKAGINGRLLVQTAVTLDQSSVSSPQ